MYKALESANYANKKGREIHIRNAVCFLCNDICWKDIQSIIFVGAKNRPNTHTHTHIVLVGNRIEWIFFSLMDNVMRMSIAWWHTLTYTWKADPSHMCNEILKYSVKKRTQIPSYFHIFYGKRKMQPSNSYTHAHTHITRLRNISIFAHRFHSKIQHFTCLQMHHSILFTLLWTINIV